MFIVIFGAIGGIILLASHAASAPVAPVFNSVSAPQLGPTSAYIQSYPVLNWSVPSSDGGSPISYYKIYRGTTAGGEASYPVATLGPTWTSWTDDTVTSISSYLGPWGLYYYKITAVNAFGQSVQSNERSVTTNSSSNITDMPRLDDGGCSGVRQYLGSDFNATSNNQPTFMMNGDGGLATYNLYINGSTPLTRTGLINGYVTCWKVPSALADGYYQITGNEISPNPANPVAPFEFRVDSSVPPTPTTAPTLASYSKTGNPAGNYTNFSNPKLTGTYDLSNYNVTADGLPQVELRFTESPGSPGGSRTDSNGNYTIATTSSADGTYHYYVTVSNEVNTHSPNSPTTAVTIDAHAPTTSAISSPSSGSTVSGTSAITTSTADNSGGSGIWKVALQVDGVTKQTATSAPFSFNWDTTAVANGSHNLGVIAYDNAGNTLTSSSISVNVQNATTTVPGAPTLSTPTAGNTTASLSWTAPSSNGGSAITGYKVYRGTTSGSESLLTSLGNVTSFGDTNLTNGTTYYYQVSAVNGVGEGGRSAENSVTPATTPGAPSINSVTGGNTSIALAWTAPTSNGGSAITGYKVYRSTSSGGESLLNTLGNVTNFTDSGLTPSTTYYYKVSAVNSLGEGLKSSEGSAKTLDSIPPSVSITSPASNSTISGTVTVSANASDNVGISKVVFSLDGTTVLGTITSSPYGTSWNTATVANGSHSITATAYDTSNNTTTSSVSFTVANADTTHPTVSITSPVANSTVSGTAAISANASDNISVSKVVFLIDGVAVATDTISPYSYSWDTTTVSNNYHAISATAYDTSNNTTTASESVNVSNGDITPPSTPTSLSATAPAYNRVNLSWAASTDNVGVAGYYVVRNGTTIAQTSGTTTTYTDTSVIASTSYSYQIMAYDAAGNTSGLSNTASVTTSAAPDTTPPSTPTNLTATAASSSQINLSWTASTDNVGVTSYDVFRNSTKQTTLAASSACSGSICSYGSVGLTASTTYSYYVVAHDAAGNSSLASNTASVTTPTVPDTTPPTTPLNLAATAVSSSQINLAWTKSTDNIGVKGYRVFRNSMLIATVTSNSFGDATVFASTKYNYTVKAFDAAGNVSNASTTTSATTLSSSKSAKLKGVTYYHTSTSTTNHILGSTTINLPYKGTNHYYTSNATTGAFNIVGIPPVSYTVTFSKAGYQSKTLTMTLTASQIKTQNASLLKN